MHLKAFSVSVVNPWYVCAARVTVLCVCVCLYVGLSLVVCYKLLKNKMAIFLNSRVLVQETGSVADQLPTPTHQLALRMYIYTLAMCHTCMWEMWHKTQVSEPYLFLPFV